MKNPNKPVTTNFRCRSCGCSNGTMVLDLGNQPLANNLLTGADLAKPEPRFPLRMAVCESCWLLQITDLVPPVELFSEYLYFSSFSDALLRHAREASLRYIEEFELGPQSLVVEIASNDGYLLENFQRAGVPCLGIEPAANVAQVAREKGIETTIRFFCLEVAREMSNSGIRADLILGNNVFAHVPEPNDFVAGLRTLLTPQGRVILEFPYAADLIEHTEFDTIYHEHIFYFTLTALIPLFERQGMSIYHVERLALHGGSLRVFACYTGSHPVQGSVLALLEEELGKRISSLAYYLGFASQVRVIKDGLSTLLRRLKVEGRSIAIYGASAKGSTLLNFIDVERDTFDFVVDRSTHKQGRRTPGTHIPILPTDQLRGRQPDYTLLLTWNFEEEILHQQAPYREAGGKFIIPIPAVRIV